MLDIVDENNLYIEKSRVLVDKFMGIPTWLWRMWLRQVTEMGNIFKCLQLVDRGF